ncbi:putative PHD type zinc finger protein with BAH domain-containing protein [Arachnomyces sp. PD_36]|nr:putative PHD type zinc finger protein with BAH domain-containing protein [Arachnomyces sp. PD_36]
MASDKSPPRQQLPAAAASSDSTLSSAGETSDKPSSASNGSSKGGSADVPATRDAATANGLQSQPMTTTTSTSSDHAVAEPASSSNTPAPYGTRSRNRNGAPRPNYAEDGDGDMEFEATPSAPRGTRKVAGASVQNSSNASPATEGDRTSGVSTRRAHATANGNNTKDAIPGTSSFFAGPNATNGSSASKKRKQPGSSNAQSSPAPAPPSTLSKKTGTPTIQYSNPQTQTDTSMLTFDNCGGYMKNDKLVADDGTSFEVNDHAYMICEPPGEPYYLCRLMEFLPGKDDPNGPIEMVRVNWYYRPRDIHRNLTDSRLLFASMHSDVCPLTSLRGKCQVLHISEIKDLEEYRRTRDCFWYEKMFDRYIHRYYDVIATSTVINVPEEVKKVLDERWRFVTVETGHPRRKELTSAVKTCKKCRLYAANNNSVDCAVCDSTFHMACVRPVLEKKPARGFAWACAFCSSERDRKLEARSTPIPGESRSDVREDVEHPEDEEDDKEHPAEKTEESPAAEDENKFRAKPATPEQIALSKIWPYRYLGAHMPVEDVLDDNDRIYPRAGSRLGNKYQFNVIPWPGRPVEYVKAPEIKKKYMRGSGHRKDGKLSKETIAAIEADKAERAKRPKWVLDEPAGYLPRGGDEPIPVGNKEVHTSELRFKMPDASQLPSRGEDDDPGASMSVEEREKFIDDYMERAKAIAPSKDVEKYSTNFLDKAISLLYEENFKTERALARLKQVNKYTDLKEPRLRPEEVKSFENGVAKYGSELRNVSRHVGTVPHRHIVRFYYMWKKTDKGRQIWGNFHGRRRKKEQKRMEKMKLVDDIADDNDDSAFDSAKAAAKKRGFSCLFCSSKSSRRWRRAPTTLPGGGVVSESGIKREKGQSLTVALCQRCAVLWRKYGIRWENLDEVAKKITQGGNKSWRRRADEELLTQLIISAEGSVSMSSSTAAMATSMGVPVPASMTSQQQPTPQQQEPPKKKAKTSEKDRTSSPAVANPPAPEPVVKKKPVVEKPPEPPALVPEPPRAKMLPCAICDKMEPMGDQYFSCRDCRLTVHRSCYGISPERSTTKWFCDMCSNDRNPTRSTSYECIMCPVNWTEHELMEPPKISHKRKTDREREKERVEKEMLTEAVKLYRQRQEAAGKPVGPREPLKPTAGNNWVHVTCAVWTPEIKFGDAKRLEPVEGLGLIPTDRFQATCKVCKGNSGACVQCHNSSCNAQFHVGCAYQAGYIFGFDVNPVKSSRRDSVNMIKLGEETGAATAAIWCPHHTISTIIHKMGDPSEKEGLNALQLYAQTFKQADLTLTGTVRKAAHIQQSVGASTLQSALSSNRRVSTTNGTGSNHYRDSSHSFKARKMSPTDSPSRMDGADSIMTDASDSISLPKKCSRCQTTCSPKWWPITSSRRHKVNGPSQLANGTGHGEHPEAGPGQDSGPRINGDSRDDDRHATGYNGESSRLTSRRTGFECHKCHLKKRSPSPSSSPEPRVSPYAAPPGPAQPIRPPGDYPPNAYGAPPAGQPPGIPRAQMVPVHGPEYEQRHGNPNLRNGVPPGAPQANGIPPSGPHSGYPGGPPGPQPHVNGYAPPPPPHHPSQAPPPQPHYANGVPPPPHGPHIHSYQAHQSPYPPVAPAPPGSHQPPMLAPAGHPYGPAASPPEVHSNLVQRSPSRSLGGPSPPRPLPPRMYSVERVMHGGPPQQPTSGPRPSMDSNRPSTPGMGMNADDASNAGPAPRPTSSSRNANTSNAPPGSGASASPSLKNLLS